MIFDYYFQDHSPFCLFCSWNCVCTFLCSSVIYTFLLWSQYCKFYYFLGWYLLSICVFLLPFALVAASLSHPPSCLLRIWACCLLHNVTSIWCQVICACYHTSCPDNFHCVVLSDAHWLSLYCYEIVVFMSSCTLLRTLEPLQWFNDHLHIIVCISLLPQRCFSSPYDWYCTSINGCYPLQVDLYHTHL